MARPEDTNTESSRSAQEPWRTAPQMPSGMPISSASVMPESASVSVTLTPVARVLATGSAV